MLGTCREFVTLGAAIVHKNCAGMAVKEQSFVLKRGEGLNDRNLIKHTVLHHHVFETPRASSVDCTPKTTPVLTSMTTKVPVKTSYISPMARARQQAKLRREAGDSNSNGVPKEWDDSIPSSSSPSSESAMSSISNGTPPSKTPVRLIPYSGGLIPSSGLIASSGNGVPKFGYIPKSGTTGEELTGGGGSGRLPKFGVWDNNNEASAPSYTLLFENVAQEKRIGGPIRIHAPRPCSPARSEDLYNYNPTSIKAARKTRQYHSLLCCFVGS